MALLAPGQMLGRYQLLVEVAAGGMGTIWAARQTGHPLLRRTVALKVALDVFAKDAESRKMFLDEARLASSVQHPNVCSVTDLGEDDGRLFLVMDWVGGGTLADLLARQPEKRLPFSIAARIVAEACAGLHAAHELRDEAGQPLELIHRDVSPQNVLLTPDGHVKVADFGIARARNQLHQLTSAGTLKGKLSYMAAEQFGGHPYDRRVDIFALGCVLYRASVGRRPFEGADGALMYQILEGQFECPSAVVGDFPPELEAIILRAMSRTATDRYPTAEAMQVALEHWLVAQGAPCGERQLASAIGQALGDRIAERAARINQAMADLCPQATERRDAPLSLEEPEGVDVALECDDAGSTMILKGPAEPSPCENIAFSSSAQHSPKDASGSQSSAENVAAITDSVFVGGGGRTRAPVGRSSRRLLAAVAVFTLATATLRVGLPMLGPKSAGAANAAAAVPQPRSIPAAAPAEPLPAFDRAGVALSIPEAPRTTTASVDDDPPRGGIVPVEPSVRVRPIPAHDASPTPRSTRGVIKERDGLGGGAVAAPEPSAAITSARPAPSGTKRLKPIDHEDPFRD